VLKDFAILELVSALEKGGYVKETFAKAVLEREIIFPTGLPTQPVGIAIPHTDCEHVKKGAIAVGILKTPVVFQEMGSLDSNVEVSIISVLAIENPDYLVNTLRQLATVFQNENFLLNLQQASTQQEVLNLYYTEIPEVVQLDNS
jgi:PTS system galactitol-specific IIA component